MWFGNSWGHNFSFLHLWHINKIEVVFVETGVANGLMMTTLGVIEMSVFAIIKREKVNLLNTTSKQVDHLY